MLSNVSILTEILFIIGAVSLIGSSLFSIYKIAKKIDLAIGTDANGRSINERLEKVEYQLWPNNGKSLADRVNKTERNSAETSAEVSVIKELVIQIIDNHTTPKKRTVRKKN